jgi:formylglycine-generating enzyme required for sulfatase activity
MKKLLGFLLCGLLLGGVSGEFAQANNKTFTNSLGMEFVLIPAGQFSHRWTEKTKNDFDEESTQAYRRVVTISKPFYLGKYEVTQEQWVAVMGAGSNHAVFKGRNNPVENVSWEEVQVFIRKLNEKEGGNKYRLPTEAEWEHAARAGSTAEWFFGNDPAELGQYAWFSGNSGNSTHPVGEKKPNPWGLYDIYGNVWDFVADWFEKYKAGTVTDPAGPTSSAAGRVYRGGAWHYSPDFCRSSVRGNISSDLRHSCIGFRLAFSPDQ